MDEPDVGLSAMDRGTLVHRVLEPLWKNLQTQARLLAMPVEELDALIRTSVENSLAECVAKQEHSPALASFRQLEQRRLEDLVRRWLEVEKGRPPFTVIQSEAARKASVAGLILELRVDRIDRYDNGPSDNATHAIIDYKTSKQLKKDMLLNSRRPL
jgi:ATP-dependent helicase/DNAse subunit B